MKRAITPIIVIILAGTAFWFRDLWLPPPAGQAQMLGYVEGETVMIASPVAGRIVERKAEKGQTVAAGTVLFRLDATAQQSAVDQAEAAVATAEAQLANLATGKRAPELDVIRAQRQEAVASLTLAKQELQRATELNNSGTATKARYDTAAAQVAQIEARIAQFDASLAAAELGGRAQDIAAATSRINEAQAAAQAAKAKLADLSPVAPLAAQVEDTYYDPGEWVAAGSPIVALIAPENVKLRFYVPEQDLAKAQPGTVVKFTCDGCTSVEEAKITSVAATPEYTPPVIYSQNARAKLVYLVEAKPAAPDPQLRPGLPIAVEPLQ